VTPFSRF